MRARRGRTSGPTFARTVVPEGTWVSRVEPSHFDAGTAYVSFDGHRRDDFKPYILKTTDYGKSWAPIASNLPAKPSPCMSSRKT